MWDNFGLPHIRLLAEIAAVLDPSVDRKMLSQPLTVAIEMSRLWRELGFRHVEQTSLLIRMEYSCFEDYWTPFTRGEGPPGQLVANLSDNIRSALTDHLRNAYLSGRPDGPRSIPCVAWACRGTCQNNLRPQEWRVAVEQAHSSGQPSAPSLCHSIRYPGSF